MTIEYQDFIVYQLENDGTYTELDIPQTELVEYLSSDRVFLLVRQDLRRLFIWKGPTSPVRRRFISSRVASEVQENIRTGGGRHLKIVSIDAGDETVEFLSAFDLEPFEVTEKLADMRYIRNAEREKMKQDALKAKLDAKRKKEEGEYWSPLLEEAKKKEEEKSALTQKTETPKVENPKTKTVKEETLKTEEEEMSFKSVEGKTKIPKAPVKKLPAKKVNIKKPPIKSHVVDDKPVPKAKSHEPVSLNSLQNLITEEKGKKIIDEVLQMEPPEGLKRMNIIIGQNLYAPNISKSIVLGKSIEKEDWNIIKDLPSGVIDLVTSKLRFIIDEKFKIIKAIEIYQDDEESEHKKERKNSEKSSESNAPSSNVKKKPSSKKPSVKKNSSKKTTSRKTALKKTSAKKSKRKLPEIPKK